MFQLTPDKKNPTSKPKQDLKTKSDTQGNSKDKKLDTQINSKDKKSDTGPRTRVTQNAKKEDPKKVTSSTSRTSLFKTSDTSTPVKQSTKIATPSKTSLKTQISKEPKSKIDTTVKTTPKLKPRETSTPTKKTGKSISISFKILYSLSWWHSIFVAIRYNNIIKINWIRSYK